ncbi:CRISPR-associated protein Cas1 [Elusimicrobium minutum Pei191]|uniref:CRISPR-associated endonuclease Cas1 n=1 Tax=Elusimicrobium minutum (strain Pei191) TaxID=445932 RepID=B2KB47_ELUMP|nr:type II CRISPR-associated endonuclease Cas1 [Elusimicrobium minutum]ACC97806.1 CRISPR-associated protein Cas1 [Elusimicrobium minutum Pei191]
MWRVLDIPGDGYHLCVKNNNFSAVKDREEKLHCLFDDINSIILYGNNITISNTCIQKCLEHKVPVIFCDKTYNPAGMLLSSFTTNIYGRRLQLQINASKPQIKQAWQQIITSKLNNQAEVLKRFDTLKAAETIFNMAREVRSGDATFKEGVGAKVYFENLFNDFHRNTDDKDIINSALNYGYAIVRSSIARAVVSAGLNPAIGIFHSKNHNPFCLIDDLIEPLRPLIDFMVKNKLDVLTQEESLSPSAKKYMASVIESNLYFEDGAFNLTAGIQKYIQSYIAFLEERENRIIFPAILK